MDHARRHSNAITAAANHRKAEMELLSALEEIWRNKTFYQYGCSSLFEYSTQQLKLSEELASIYNKLAKKFIEVPELKAQIASGEISVSKGNRVCSVITKENCDVWIPIAQGPKRNLEKQIAKAQPDKAIPERARYCKAGDTVRIEISYTLTEEEFKTFERTKDLLSQKLKRPATNYDVCSTAVDHLHKELDPLIKSCPPKNSDTLSPIKKRQVHHNCQGQCTYINKKGERCPQKRHLDIHHIKPRSEGGTHDITNLTLLCAGHHRARHTIVH